MAKKLLHKTLRMYLLCSIGILLVAAPLFYFSMTRLYMEDVDETLVLYKKEFHHYYLPHFKRSSIEDWNRYNRDIKIQPTVNPLLSDTFFYQKFFDTLDNENEPYRVLQSPVAIENESYLLMARISLVESEDLMENIAIIFTVLIALLLGLLVFATSRFSKKIWQPFRRTLEKLKAFDLSAGQTVSFDKTNVSEFDELNGSLSKLIAHNVSVYKTQKEFTENASHELQTPLAILKNKLDILLQSEGLTEKQYQIAEEMNRALTRSTRINKNLLLLAKIDNSQFNSSEAIHFDVLLQQSMQILQEHFEQKNIRVSTNISSQVTVHGNSSLTEVLINNLLLNAIRHTLPGGSITVTLTQTGFEVSNSGTAQLDADLLFKRFSRLSADNSGSGLGLSIVQEICKFHKWSIHYTFQNGYHSFSVHM
ncbi:MAG: sensor histidine kinase [Agriterribacter sp.]